VRGAARRVRRRGRVWNLILGVGCWWWLVVVVLLLSGVLF
jgi:hypothetical protein